MRKGVVTPEAVLLDLPTAGVGTRGFARAIDIVVQVIVLVVLGLIATLTVNVGVSPVLAGLVALVLTLIAWPIFIEVIWSGRSMGKAVFGLRVVGSDGSPVQPRQSVTRALLALIEIYLSLGFLAVITAMFSPVSQRLGDLAASTVVIREPRTASGASPVVFYPPAGLESYVASLDVTRLDPDDFALIRSFLLRVGSMLPQARFDESVRLAEGVRTRIDHVVPGRLDAETWLVCVASAFQWRQGGLLRDVALGLAPVAVTAPREPTKKERRAEKSHRRTYTGS